MGCSRGDRATNTRCLQSHTLFAGHLPELCPRDKQTCAGSSRAEASRPRGSGFGNRPGLLGRCVPLPVLFFSSYKVSLQAGTRTGGKERERACSRDCAGRSALPRRGRAAGGDQRGREKARVRVRFPGDDLSAGGGKLWARALPPWPGPPPLSRPTRSRPSPLPLPSGAHSLWGGCWEGRPPSWGHLCRGLITPSSRPHSGAGPHFLLIPSPTHHRGPLPGP